MLARRSVYTLVSLALVASLAPLPALPAAAAAPVPAPRLRRPPASEPATTVVVQLAQPGLTPRAVATLVASGAETRPVDVEPHGQVVVKPRRGMSAIALARALGGKDGVKWAAPNVRMTALAADVPPDDTYYSAAFGTAPAQRTYMGARSSYANAIDLEPAWAKAFNGTDHAMDLSRAGVPVAVVDTGYRATKETPAGVFVPKYNYVANNTDTTDDEGHGTEVGNIIGASTNNGTGLSGVMYATPSQVYIYKVLDSSGSGDLSDCIAGVRAAADAGAKVINTSFGAPAIDPSTGRTDTYLAQAWADTIAYVSGKGALVVAASGNDAGAVNFPAAAKGVVAVGAIDQTTGLRSSFSSHGSQLSVVAPGGELDSTGHYLDPKRCPLVFSKDGSVEYGAGTSFSSPIVAGSIGLLWSLVPRVPAPTIVSAVTSTARDLGTAGFDNDYGYGEIDVWAAYQKLMQTVPTQPSPTVSIDATPGFATSIRWNALPGSDVVYRYGITGGQTYTTTDTSGTVYVSADGVYDVWVSATASDMWTSGPTHISLTVSTGRPALTLQRFAGADRYGTAASVSRAAFPTVASTVFIASGEGFPDALSASVLAFRSGAPLLLSARTSLPVATSDEIKRLKATSAVIIGGTPTLDSSVEASLRSLGLTTRRIAGADRYDTAAKVAAEVAAKTGSVGKVIVASGENFPDALSASPVAASAGYPILLTKASVLPSATSGAVAALGTTSTLVIGGTPSVSDAVKDELPGASRIAGADRYATSRALADYAVDAGILSREDLGIATGKKFPDALSGGVLMAQLHGAMVLGDGETGPLDSWLGGIGDRCTRVDAFGSETTIPSVFTTGILHALRAQ